MRILRSLVALAFVVAIAAAACGGDSGSNDGNNSNANDNGNGNSNDNSAIDAGNGNNNNSNNTPIDAGPTKVDAMPLLPAEAFCLSYGTLCMFDVPAPPLPFDNDHFDDNGACLTAYDNMSTECQACVECFLQEYAITAGGGVPEDAHCLSAMGKGSCVEPCTNYVCPVE
jgi:hypothetical protein